METNDQAVQASWATQKAQISQTFQAILAVSFGTSYQDSREKTIGAIEQALSGAFPEVPVYRAFTSRKIIRKLKERDGLAVDGVEEALKRAKADGVKGLVVQPTHLMDGFEYADLAKVLEGYGDQFEGLELAAPLLGDEDDCEAVLRAITDETAAYDDGETAICFMGHGTKASANAVYRRLQEKLREKGFGNYYIGTVEAKPDLEELASALKAAGRYKKVLLQPLMVVAGDHANQDMAGDEDSWRCRLEKEGLEVRCILKGLGELPGIQKIYISHAKEAAERLQRKTEAVKDEKRRAVAVNKNSERR